MATSYCSPYEGWYTIACIRANYPTAYRHSMADNRKQRDSIRIVLSLMYYYGYILCFIVDFISLLETSNSHMKSHLVVHHQHTNCIHK